MITVAIVSILAAVALPNYVRYQLKVKSAEARTMLGGIVTSQESFLAEFENYGDIADPNPPLPAGITKRVWLHIPCPTSCSRTAPSDCTSFECIGFQPPSVVYFSYAAPHLPAGPAGFPEFGAGAAADLDGDGVIGSYAYRSGNRGTGVGMIADGVSTCPANSPIQIIESCSPIAY